ncbi:hypothetical protein STAQ_07210 [Allostella sp. ATCC 35155]|nr:hypothetical protein STAQ_07210 [Stella sp. ATCC 35155]
MPIRCLLALLPTILAMPALANPMVSESAIGLGAPATDGAGALALAGVGLVLAAAAALTWRSIGR